MIVYGNLPPGDPGAFSGVRGAGGSERVRLARLARAVTLEVAGVIATDSGPTGLFMTAGDGQRVDGVTCVAAAAGGYELSLRLVCELSALARLGDQVRAAVLRAGARGGFAVARVNVHIADVQDR